MRKIKADVVFLQETLFQTDFTPKLYNATFLTVYHASNDLAKFKGISILIANHLPLVVSDFQVHREGMLGDRPITLANAYSPNVKQVSFFGQL